MNPLNGNKPIVTDKASMYTIIEAANGFSVVDVNTFFTIDTFETKEKAHEFVINNIGAYHVLNKTFDELLTELKEDM